MGDARTGSWVVFNGEIYNHLELRRELPDEFRSTSDTETLLRGWVAKGPEWVRSLRGIFAFALLDVQRQELWLVRDHLGVKPLYVSQPEEDLWLFASETRALLASGMVGKQLCTEGLNSYLAFVRRGALDAGCRHSLAHAGRAVVFPASPEPRKAAPAGVAVLGTLPNISSAAGDALGATGGLPASVLARAASCPWDRRVDERPGLGQLRPLGTVPSSQMLSDVPVGVFLSGGIDSSAIVATLARQGHNPKTFSIVFFRARF